MTGGTRRVTTPDGVELALHRMRAFRDGRPAVLLVHGAFTNHRFWLHGGMAHFLGAAGLDVWLADLRHHGESAREPRRGAWTFEDWVLRDTPTFVARVREETDGAPLAWIGHSAGGMPDPGQRRAVRFLTHARDERRRVVEHPVLERPRPPARFARALPVVAQVGEPDV